MYICDYHDYVKDSNKRACARIRVVVTFTWTTSTTATVTTCCYHDSSTLIQNCYPRNVTCPGQRVEMTKQPIFQWLRLLTSFAAEHSTNRMRRVARSRNTWARGRRKSIWYYVIDLSVALVTMTLPTDCPAFKQQNASNDGPWSVWGIVTYKWTVWHQSIRVSAQPSSIRVYRNVLQVRQPDTATLIVNSNNN